MDCNKDEAIKAKEIAEKFAETGDIAGAKKFASKAQKLYSSLEGLDSFLTTLDVYISAGKRLGGEINWYAVLGVDPTADYDTIRNNYRKLALALHPDKHKPVGADRAFKLLSQAWNILSDGTRRYAYDQKWNFQTGINSKIQNSFHDFLGNISSSASKYSGTFWTRCGSCDMQFEYIRNYLNRNLICPQCRKPFIAIEMLPLSIHGNGLWNSNIQWQRSVHQNVTPHNSNGTTMPSSIFLPSIFAMPGGVGSMPAQYSSTTQSAFRHFMQKGENVAATVLLQPDIQNALLGKAKREIQEKYKARSFAAEATKFSATDTKMKEGKESTSLNGRKTDGSKITQFKGVKPSVEAKDPSFLDSSDNPCTTDHPNASTMNVPDPDFYEFDKDRAETSFGNNQVWAAYDDDDGMPRFYAMIHCVISLKPFKLCISWLNSKNNNELSPINWIGSGFYKTSGSFWIGKRKFNSSLNSFSHKVRWTKGAKGVVQIYPKKGDVWAVYRNWSLDWNELTPDEVIKKYDMVEVLGDFDEEQGVTLSPLVKVAGFKTVFRQHPKLTTIKTFPKEEMFRFSHQVASYLLTGEEGHAAPKGHLELDPAAMPLDLLRVLDEEQVREMEEAIEKRREEVKKKPKEEMMVENQNTSIETGFAERGGKRASEANLMVYKRRRFEKQEERIYIGET